MQAAVWKSFLARVPPEYRGSLMAMTAAGMEINIQAILREEEDFLVVRGRLAGTTDTIRVLFLPFEGLDHMGFYKEMSPAQVTAILDGKPVVAPPPEGAAAPAPEPIAAVTLVPEPPPPEVPNSRPRVRLPSKSEIIERLRLRGAVKPEEPKTS